jgi:hypothetical protein
MQESFVQKDPGIDGNPWFEPESLYNTEKSGIILRIRGHGQDGGVVKSLPEIRENVVS